MSAEKEPEENSREGWVRYSIAEKMRRNSWKLCAVLGAGIVLFMRALDMPMWGAALSVFGIYVVVLFIRSYLPSPKWFCPEGHEVFQGQSYCTKCGKKVPSDEGPIWQDKAGGLGE